MNRHMQQIDHQTGEVVEGFVAYVVPKRKNGFQKGWMAMAQEAMMMLAQSNLTGNDMKVMWAMLARLDYENLIQVNQAEVRLNPNFGWKGSAKLKAIRGSARA